MRWLDAVSKYTDALSAALGRYADAEHAVANGGGAKAQEEYERSLAALTTAPQLLEEILGEGPSARTREIVDLLEQQATLIADAASRSEPSAITNQVTTLSDHIGRRIAALPKV